jgi:hypothetical protein
MADVALDRRVFERPKVNKAENAGSQGKPDNKGNPGSRAPGLADFCGMFVCIGHVCHPWLETDYGKNIGNSEVAFAARLSSGSKQCGKMGERDKGDQVSGSSYRPVTLPSERVS